MNWILGGLFVVAGVFHFITPRFFKAIIPDYFPNYCHGLLVYVSGLADIIGGIGVMIPTLQSVSAWGLFVLTLAVFPANVFMAYHPKFSHIPSWIRWGRLPLQLPLLYWIYQFTQ